MSGILGVFLIHPGLRAALYIKTFSVESPELQTFLYIIPVISMTVYMISLGTGAGTLQGVYLGELLPESTPSCR